LCGLLGALNLGEAESEATAAASGMRSAQAPSAGGGAGRNPFADDDEPFGAAFGVLADGGAQEAGWASFATEVLVLALVLQRLMMCTSAAALARHVRHQPKP